MLTHKQIENLKARNRVYRVADSRGLCIEVRPQTGAKLWRYRYRFAGVPKMISLGEFPDVSLADAREDRDDLRKMLRQGKDPAIERKQEKRAAKIAQANSVAAVAREWVERAVDSKGHPLADATKKKNKWLLNHYLFPALGNRPISEVTPRELLDVLRKPEAEGKLETANRLKSKCGQIWRYAVTEGKAETDITASLKGALKSPDANHHAAITEPKELGKLLQAIEGYDGHVVTKAALRFTPLVFQRPGEIRHAEWEEMDLDKGEWRFKSQKTKKDMIVPLSKQAVAILRNLYTVTGSGRYVFPSNRRGRPMSNNTINTALRTMGFTGDEVTAHGFRATARTMLVEQKNLRFPVDIVEMQLGHNVADVHGRAYNRVQWLDERKAMMQKWADYLEGLKG